MPIHIRIGYISSKQNNIRL